MSIELLALLLSAALLAAAVAGRRRRSPARARREADGTQVASVVVRGRYAPSTLELVAGVPAVLRFDRREADACSEKLVCELLPSEHHLAPHAVTTVRFTPTVPGTYAFTCGLGMYAGRLIVREPRSRRLLSRRPARAQHGAPGYPGDPLVRR